MTPVYDDLLSDLRGLFDGETDLIANAANAAAAMWQYLPNINWAGFYFMQGDTLVLGPFAGKPACVRITLGRGVCGTAAANRATIVVPDVHAFPGHIACDSASNSEIVVPLIRNGVVIGVLDIDSPTLDRFQQDDRIGCEAVASLFIKALG
ncbi:MAG: GAF domain-containing protein [Acetobacteraceae bacterium]|nr:GAF domain-containing protein [Acetobacteraceae bacterium]